MTQHTHDEVIAWIEKELLFLDLCNDEQGWESSSATNYRASLLANRAGLERHKERPFNWMTDQVIGMFSEAFPEPPQLPRCVTCRHIDFPCPSYTEIYDPIVSVM